MFNITVEISLLPPHKFYNDIKMTLWKFFFVKRQTDGKTIEKFTIHTFASVDSGWLEFWSHWLQWGKFFGKIEKYIYIFKH